MIREIKDAIGDTYYSPICDGGGCSAEVDGMFDSPRKAVDAMKAAGWVTVEDGAEICDYCPNCKRRKD